MRVIRALCRERYCTTAPLWRFRCRRRRRWRAAVVHRDPVSVDRRRSVLWLLERTLSSSKTPGSAEAAVLTRVVAATVLTRVVAAAYRTRVHASVPTVVVLGHLLHKREMDFFGGEGQAFFTRLSYSAVFMYILNRFPTLCYAWIGIYFNVQSKTLEKLHFLIFMKNYL